MQFLGIPAVDNFLFFILLMQKYFGSGENHLTLREQKKNPSIKSI
jgi:hypothetical protein